MLALIEMLRRRPKIMGWTVDVCTWEPEAPEGFPVFDKEILLKLSVSNLRPRKVAVSKWTLRARAGKQSWELRPELIPLNYVVTRPSNQPSSDYEGRTKETEWPVSDARPITAQPFDQAEGWLRFLIPHFDGDLDTATLVATDNLHRKHKIAIALEDSGIERWDADDPRERHVLQQFPGPKPPIQPNST